MTLRSRLTLALLLLSGCADGTPTPDHSPDWFVPYKIGCSANCPATHTRAELSKCTDAGRGADHTAGCQSTVTECFCTAKREPLPAVLP